VVGEGRNTTGYCELLSGRKPQLKNSKMSFDLNTDDRNEFN
jgi:hypothetical protein